MNRWADDPLGQANAATFQQALQDLGWTEGKNLRADYRWRGEFISSSAAELVKLAPDLILAAGSSNLAAVQQATRTILASFTTSKRPHQRCAIWRTTSPCQTPLARQHVVIEPNAGASFRHDRRERRLAHLELVAEALPPMAQVSERSCGNACWKNSSPVKDWKYGS